MRLARFFSLRGRLLLLVLLATASAFAVLIYTAREQRLAATANAKYEALTLTRKLVQKQAALVTETRQYLSQLAQRPELDEPRAAACSVFLAGELSKTIKYTNIGATDIDGHILCSARPAANRAYIGDRSYFARTRQTGDLSIGDYQIGGISGKASIGFGFPKYDRKGKLQGIIFSNLDLNWLNEFIAGIDNHAGLLFSVIDSRGVLLAHSQEADKWVGKTMPHYARIKGAMSQKEETFVEAPGFDGVDRLWTFAPLLNSGDAPAYISVGISRKTAYAKVTRTTITQFLLLVSITSLLLLITWYGIDVLVLRPLRALIGATQRIASGERGVRTGTAANAAELNELARSFDDMAAALERQENDRQRVEEERRQGSRDVEILYEIGQSIINSENIETIYRRVLDKTLAIAGCEIGVIRVLDRVAQTLRPVESRGYRVSENIRSLSVAANDSGIGRTQAEVFNKKGATVVENLSGHDGLRSFKLEGALCAIALPIKANDRVLGTIQLGSRSLRSFKPGHIRLLEAIGDQLGIAVQNSYLDEETRRAYKEIRALYAVTTAANQSLNLDNLLNQVIRTVSELFECDMARVYLADPGTDEIVLRASYDHSPEAAVPAGELRRSQGIGSFVMDSGKPEIFEDILSDPRYAELSRTRNLEKSAIRFFATFPIKNHGRPLGVVSIYRRVPRRLTQNEIRLFNAIGEQVGIAVEHARLYEQTTAKAAELSALYATAAIASESLDVTTLLRGVLNKVLSEFGHDAGRIYLRRSGDKDLDLVAFEGFTDEVKIRQRYLVGDGLLGRIVGMDDAYVCADLQTESLYNQFSKQRTMASAGFRSAFYIPIKIRGEILGVMNVLDKQPGRFSDSEVRLLKSIAYHLGVALGNARLFSEVTQKTVELEQANRAKDEFLSVMSHELRTPLNVIMGYAEALSSGFMGQVTPEQDKSLKKLMLHANDLLSMINDILQAGRIQSGLLDVAVERFDVAELCAELESAYAVRAKAGIALGWKIDSAIPVIRSDRSKLKHILQNLVNNAIKFTDEGSVEITARSLPQGLEFTVADTGIGIPSESLPNIFNMFQQADSSKTRSYGGAGVGLYIVRKFTEALNGKLDVRSVVGEGSTFTVTLPLEIRAQQPSPSSEQSFARLNPAPAAPAEPQGDRLN